MSQSSSWLSLSLLALTSSSAALCRSPYSFPSASPCLIDSACCSPRSHGGRLGAEQTGITDLMQTAGAGFRDGTAKFEARVSGASPGLILPGAGGAEQTGTADLILTGEALDVSGTRHLESEELGLFLYVVDCCCWRALRFGFL